MSFSSAILFSGALASPDNRYIHVRDALGLVEMESFGSYSICGEAYVVTLQNSQSKRGLCISIHPQGEHSLTNYFTGLRVELEYANKPNNFKLLKDLPDTHSKYNAPHLQLIGLTLSNLTSTVQKPQTSSYEYMQNDHSVNFRITVDCQKFK